MGLLAIAGSRKDTPLQRLDDEGRGAVVVFVGMRLDVLGDPRDLLRRRRVGRNAETHAVHRILDAAHVTRERRGRELVLARDRALLRLHALPRVEQLRELVALHRVRGRRDEQAGHEHQRFDHCRPLRKIAR